MEKNPHPDQNDNVSSPRDNSETVDAKSDGQRQHEQQKEETEVDQEDPPPSDPELSLTQILDEVDRFLEILPNAQEGKSDPPDQVPNSVELLSKMVESMIDAYNACKTKFGRDPEDDAAFLEAVNRISKLSNGLDEFPSNSALSSSLNRASSVLQRAMSFLEDELRVLLHEDQPKPINIVSDHKSQKPSKQSSFDFNHEHDRCLLPDPIEQNKDEEEFPGFSQEAISNINKIASAMIFAGYESECCMVYGILRRSAFKGALNKLGYEYLSIDDVQRMQWESLEGELTLWINVVKQCSTNLFSGEQNLCDSVFSDHPSVSQTLFIDLARPVVIQLLDFAEALVLTKRSAEKLFKFLDMYESLRDLFRAMHGGPYPEELISEASEAKTRLGEAAMSIFCDLENSIKSDHGRTPVPSGAVHPLTRYVMNYLKYACEYKETLEQVFQQHLKIDKGVAESDDGSTPKTSPFSVQLLTIMDLLDANLDMKSKLYKDNALCYVFLMNNGRYILQKIKGSTEIHELMGDTWCRKRSSLMRQYHKNYQREAWSKVLQCLNHEGVQASGHGKVSKPVLKERFKNFNAMFDEIHKTQTTWVVSDEQLQSELRVSISAIMIPAYRAFLGRFQQYLAPGRQSEKYIKYQPDDIETLIDELFDGNPTSMARRRT
jgi:exocyst complex protein 7